MKLIKSIEVKNLEDFTVAYVRHIGPYKGDEQLFSNLWTKICTWVGAQGLMQQPDIKMLAMYHDDPNVTDEDKLRVSICISVPKDTKVTGEIGKMDIDGGKYAVARFEVKSDEFQQAWEWVFGSWLPTSGYLPDDKPCFEMYPEEPKDNKFVVEICVPVRPI